MAACGSASGCTNIAYPTLVINLLPAGARGMMLSVMLAALMSSLTSIFNSSSTIFAMDVWTRIRKSASELEVMIVGRVFVVFLVIVSIIWIPVIKASQGTQLYVYVQEVSSFLQPPICAIFVLGIFWGRMNEKGAFFGLLVGFIAGIIRFAIQYSYTAPECGSSEPDPTPGLLKYFHYLYFSAFLFALTALASIVFSLMSKPIDPQCIQRLTWPTRHSTQPRVDIETWQARGKVDSARQTEVDKSGGDQMESVVDQEGHAANGFGDGAAGDEGKSPCLEPVIIEDEHTTTIVPSAPSTIPRRMFNWICGIDASSKYQLSSKQVDVVDMLSIKEPAALRRLTLALTILMASCTVFLYGFFA